MGKPNVAVTNGRNGGIVIADTTTAAGQWSILKAHGGDVVFDEVVGNLTTPDGTASGLDGTTLLGGDFVVGHFTSVKLTSGTLIAYL